MIGLVVAGHGSWPSAIVESAEMIFGEITNCETCEVTDYHSASEIKLLMDSKLKQMENCNEYIILLDLFGGSPSHAAAQYIKNDNITVITGLNLVLLLEILILRNSSNLINMKSELVEIGKKGIIDLFKEINKKMEDKNVSQD